MPRLLPLSLVLLVLAGPRGAQADEAPRIDRIEIVEWGIYEFDPRARIPAPDSATGRSTLVDNLRLRRATTTIPALVGMNLGVRFRVVGSPAGARARLKFVTRFPSQGLTSPADGRTFAKSDYYSDVFVGETTYRGYSFDRDWEVEAGPWTLELWHDGRKLAEKRFMVTRLLSSAG
jgi:hypothetical protein